MKTSLSGQLGQPSLSFSPIRNVICLNMVYAFAVKGLFGEQGSEGRLPTLPQRAQSARRRISYIRAIFRLLPPPPSPPHLSEIGHISHYLSTVDRERERQRGRPTVQLTDQKGNQRTELPRRQIQHSHTHCCRC